jgi:hypothetical protein
MTGTVPGASRGPATRLQSNIDTLILGFSGSAADIPFKLLGKKIVSI